MMEAARDLRSSDWLLPFLLLRMRERTLHGYELLQEMEELGFTGLRPGEVYRTLRGAERERLVFSERGNLEYLLSRRRYGLTESGEAYIEFLVGSLDCYRQEIEAFLRVHEERTVAGVYG